MGVWLVEWMCGSMGRSGQITNYQINLDLIGIIQICLKILLFVETPPAMGGCVGGWMDDWVYVLVMLNH